MRYTVGIDLGTTNCAIAYVDHEADNPTIETLAVAQVTGPGEVDERSSLASFLLLPTTNEIKPEAMSLPWSELPPRYAVGAFARDRGAELPARLVSSAKSWLSYDGADRTGAILPWDADDEGDGPRISPVEASARYLTHLCQAWEHAIGEDHPLDEQDVLLTVPASFDAVARELTVAAARQAGLPNITLLEEPQAAFYSWLAHSGDSWRDHLSAGDVALVCDVGGGTTDFSLIAATDDGSGNLELERVAVGDHVLLGGDNIDLALAHMMSPKLMGRDGKNLSANQFRSLIHACRRAKEQMLGPDAPSEFPITILGGGSKLIGGSLKTTLTRDEIDKLVFDGFFPAVGKDDAPKQRRALGLRELGLPYASDPAVSRHLAAFLARHGKRPSVILWNGGVMKAERLRARIADIVGSWYDAPPRSLEGTNLDLAVSHGAAYYGLVRRGEGIRIRGGAARSYYIGVESSMPAIPGFEPPIKGLCVAPFGMEEGSSATLADEGLGLAVGGLTTFRFFASTSRKDDRAGVTVETDGGDVIELASVETTLDVDASHAAGTVVPVTLRSTMTEIGTLELWCLARDGSGKWKLEYSLRE